MAVIYITHCGCASHTLHNGIMHILQWRYCLHFAQWQSLILRTAILNADPVAGDVNVAPNARMAATTAAAPAGM